MKKTVYLFLIGMMAVFAALSFTACEDVNGTVSRRLDDINNDNGTGDDDGNNEAPGNGSPGSGSGEDGDGTEDPNRPLTAAITYAGEPYTSGTQFDISDTAWTGQGTAEENWTLAVIEQPVTYFAVYKTAAQTVTVTGAESDAVTIAEKGTTVAAATAGGLAATDTLAVITVATFDLVFDGGTRNFTLNVTEENARPLRVNITLNVTPNLTGAAVFMTKDADGNDTMTRLDTGANALASFVAAFTWVETNAEADTEYTIRVEQNESNVPHLLVRLQDAENAALRLRGTAAGGPKTLRPVDLDTDERLTETNAVNVMNDTYWYDAFIKIGRYDYDDPSTTFILGNNIILQSGDASNHGDSNRHYTQFIIVQNNATLVLEPGSKIDGHKDDNGNNTCVIVAKSLTRQDILQSNVRIEGGSITNCTQVQYLIIMGSLTYLDGAFYLAGGNALTLSGNDVDTIKFGNKASYPLDLVKGMVVKDNTVVPLSE
jgi:hypothetical protein